MNLQEAISSFLHEPLAENTLRYRRRYLAQFLASVGEIPVTAITIAHVTEFRHSLAKTTPSVQRETLKTIRAFFGWLRRSTDLPCLAPDRIAVPRRNEQPYSSFTDEQITRIRESIQKQVDPLVRLRDQAAFEVLYSTGFRRAELAKITMQAIDWERQKVVVVGKMGKHVRGKLGDEAIAALQALINKTSPTDAIFPPSANWLAVRFRVWSKRTGITPCHPHMLRKSAGTRFMRQTRNVELTRMFLNHDNIETTQRYLCFTEDEFNRAHAFVFGGGEHFNLSLERGNASIQAEVRCAGIDAETIRATLQRLLDSLF